MKTIQELIEFYEAIPEENWCLSYFEHTTPEGIVQRCVAGHINHHLCGKADPISVPLDWEEEPARVLLDELGISRSWLVNANNYPTVENSPKKSVLSFLSSKLKRVA